MTELTMEDATSMTLMVALLDHAQWGRKIYSNKDMVEINRPRQPSVDNVAYLRSLDPQQNSDFQNAAIQFMIASGVEDILITREIALKLKKQIENSYGIDGCKRLAEIAVHSFDASDRKERQSLVDFWSSFRSC